VAYRAVSTPNFKAAMAKMTTLKARMISEIVNECTAERVYRYYLNAIQRTAATHTKADAQAQKHAAENRHQELFVVKLRKWKEG
jgi:hypothetical protein